MKQADLYTQYDDQKQHLIYDESVLLAAGTQPFCSSRITKKMMDDAKNRRQKWEFYKDDKYKPAPLVSLLSFCMAAQYDLQYAAVGRHYLRANAINGRNAAACGRGHLVGMAWEQAQ